MISGSKAGKRACDTRLASVVSLRAKEDSESANARSLRRSAVGSAVARKTVSPRQAQEPETIDFDAEVPLDSATLVPALQAGANEQSVVPTQASNANTEALNNLVAQLENEQAEKKKLADQITELAAITKENQKIIAEKLGLGDTKMVAQGQRYLLNSATNVMTHPDNVFGKHLYPGL